MFPIASTSGLKLQKTKAVVNNFSEIKKLMNVEGEKQEKMMKEYKVTKKSFKNDKRECLSLKQRVRRDEEHLTFTRSKIVELLALLDKMKETESQDVALEVSM